MSLDALCAPAMDAAPEAVTPRPAVQTPNASQFSTPANMNHRGEVEHASETLHGIVPTNRADNPKPTTPENTSNGDRKDTSRGDREDPLHLQIPAFPDFTQKSSSSNVQTFDMSKFSDGA